MRILHTSDWHLGVEYFQRTRSVEQAAFLEWLLATIEEKQVDTLVVAGDVFDSANPPAEALQLYYSFIARLTGAERATVAIVVGGNHDSPSRLDAPREVLTALRAHVVGGYDAGRLDAARAEPGGMLIPVHDAAGHVHVVVAAVPYLHDWRLGVRGFDGSADEQRQSLHEAFKGVYSRLADKAAKEWPGLPLLATGHLTCLARAGDMTSAEDAIPVDINRVGTLGAMGPGVFDERFGYVALGHIHRGFTVDPERRVWYSGTPLQVGADERWDARRVLLVDVDERGVAVTSLPVPTTRRLLRLRGPADEVRQELAKIEWGAAELPPYVVVEATVAELDPGLRETLRGLAPEGPGGAATIVDVRTLLQRGAGTEGGSLQDRLPPGDSVTPEQAFLFAWQMKHGEQSLPGAAVMQRFRSLLESPGAVDQV